MSFFGPKGTTLDPDNPQADSSCQAGPSVKVALTDREEQVMTDQIRPFVLAIPDSVLSDLKSRLANTRWPEKETVSDWSQGAPLAKVQALVDHWRHRYDWRRCEALLNGFGQYKTTIDGLDIHFLHIRSPHANAFPLIISHGWPGSVMEFHKVIRPLTDPVAHGGEAREAFDLVVPSLPGYGFSDRPSATGWTTARIARAWTVLMERLGYQRYGAQGGDWGAAVTTHMGHQSAQGLAGIHLNVPQCMPGRDAVNLIDEETALIKSLAEFSQLEAAYSMQQATRPQTLGYGLADSPVGQAAWIYEKFKAWTDCDGEPENIFSQDELLDNIMLYWLSNTATSSARLYWESFATAFDGMEVNVPAGCSTFPKEVITPPRSMVERYYKQLVYWNELERGGHFAAFEQPAAFVKEVRACFRLMR